MTQRLRPRPRRPAGFTLVELLVVILIVLLVSAVTLPTVIPALTNQQVSQASRILQAGLAGARDAAIRANNPRGIRLLLDPTFGVTDATRAYNRYIPIEPAPDISDGFVTFNVTANSTWSNAKNLPPRFPFPFPGDTTWDTLGRGNYLYTLPPNLPGPVAVLMIEESIFINNVPDFGPNPPTSWFWNVRIGDRFRFSDSGRYYTVVGPMTQANPEMFVNDGAPGVSSLAETYTKFDGTTVTVNPEFLFLVNGVDDDNDGYVDNGINGVNENGNFYDKTIPGLSTTAGVPAVDDLAEWTEVETWLGSQATQAFGPPVVIPNPVTPASPILVRPVATYAIARRPVASANALEVTLPAGAVIDATTWDTTHERSRLPIDPNSPYVDIMLNQSGQVIPTTTYSNPASFTLDASFYHFWIADRTDVYPPSLATGTPPNPGKNMPLLPIPSPPGGIVYTGVNNVLRKDRQLVTLYTRNGQILTNSVEAFDFLNAFGRTKTAYDQNVPFDDAQQGIREAK